MVRDRGPAAVTTVAVARQVGIAQSAVYRHARDVGELRRIAIHRVIADLDAELRRMGARNAPRAPGRVTGQELLGWPAAVLPDEASTFGSG